MLPRILGALLFAAMLVPRVSFGAESPVAGILVSTGVIFTAEQAQHEDRWLGLSAEPDFRSYWTPTIDDVAQIETKLKAYLEASPEREGPRIAAALDRYRRQYVGYSNDRGKSILVNAFCDEYVKTDLKGDDRLWREQVVLVFDGGSCFFRVHYGLSPARFERLWINGEG